MNPIHYLCSVFCFCCLCFMCQIQEIIVKTDVKQFTAYVFWEFYGFRSYIKAKLKMPFFFIIPSNYLNLFLGEGVLQGSFLPFIKVLRHKEIEKAIMQLLFTSLLLKKPREFICTSPSHSVLTVRGKGQHSIIPSKKEITSKGFKQMLKGEKCI